jgi:hypothetical protein
MNREEKILLATISIGLAILFIISLALAIQVSELKSANLALSKRTSELENSLTALLDEKRQMEAVVRRYRLSRPTLEQLQMFLWIDATNWNSYSPDSYVCINYAKDLKEAARLQGYNISFIVVNVKGYSYYGGITFGHAFNGAILADGRRVYIEPSKDLIVFDIEDILKRTEPGRLCYSFKILTMAEVW